VTLVLLGVGLWLVGLPRWLSPLGRRLQPHERVRFSLIGLVLGAVVVELALVMLAVPTVLSAIGVDALAVACRRVLGDLAPGGLQVGWSAAVLALLFPLLGRRGWLRARAFADETRVESALGIHRMFAEVELVQLPTDAVVAYSLDGARPQIVVSDGLVALLSSRELELLIGHELAHIRAHHGLVLRILAAVDAAVPGGQWLTRPVRTAVERCADEAATQGVSDARSVLLDALLRVAASDPPVGVAAFTSRSSVVERAHALLADPPAPTRAQRAGARAALFASTAIAAGALGAWAFEAHMMLAMVGICHM
jgi:Zn-dependent protease with chaperone function